MQQALGWPNGSRLKTINIGAKSKGTQNPLIWDIPRTGLLSRIILRITATLTGTLGTPNALGAASIIRRVRLTLNSAINLIDVSGVGYGFLARDFLEHNIDSVPQSTGRNAVSITTFNLDMVLPVALNSRDPLGLVMLQNQDTNAQLTVEFETDSVVASGGATVTATVTPWLELFTVPAEPKNWPPLQFLHTLREETQVVSAAGDVTYYWPRGNVYCSIIHGLGLGATPADGFSAVKLRVNQSDFLLDAIPDTLSLQYNSYHGRARVLGVIPIDLLSSSGLGVYGSARDFFDSDKVTDVASVITATGAGTLYTMKRELIPIDLGG